MLINAYYDLAKEKDSLFYALINFEIEKKSLFLRMHDREEALIEYKYENDELKDRC